MSLSSLQPYVYSPLPSPTSIRLLRRHGSRENGSVNVSIEVVDLATPPRMTPYHRQSQHRPRFHCLSYTWGNPHAYGNGFEESFNSCDAEYNSDNLFDINCEGKILKIRKNLHDFFCEAPIHWIRSIRNRPNPETGKIYLHDRATGDHVILHMYVGEGDQVNATDLDGRTPLHYAAQSGKLENVKILLKGGALTEVKDRGGQIPQDLALENGHLDVVDLLKARKAGENKFLDDVPDFYSDGADDYVWIDAVCVDQKNTEERERQVRIMNLIYSNAAYVLAWLGGEDKYTDAAMSAMSKLASAGEKYASGDFTPYRTHSPERYTSLSIPYISDDEWKGLAALFLRQWFRRIWVIQEAVFATGIVMYCGQKKINWNELEYVTSLISAREKALGHAPSTIYVPLNDIASGIEYYFWQIRILREDARELEKSTGLDLKKRFNLRRLMFLSAPFRATDPRDKIYALTPMSVLNSDQVTIQPNYQISAAQCYANFTRILLVDMGILEVFSYVRDQSTNKVDGLPSWVPDFSLSGLSPLFHQDFSAPGDLNQGKAFFGPQICWSELSIKGVPFEMVAAMAAPRLVNGLNKKYELDESWFDLLGKINAANKYQGSLQSLGEILWRTLCADMGSNYSHPAPQAFGLMFRHFLCALMCSQPELNFQEAALSRENSITLAGLMSTAITMTEGNHANAELQGPDEALLTRLRSNLPPDVRSIKSQHFDCVRHVLDKLEALTQDRNEPYLPTTEDIDEYFRKGARPVRDANGYVNVPMNVVPFSQSHSAVYGFRRLFMTKSGYLGLGPVSVETGDVVWLLPGFKMPVILRRVKDNPSEGTDSKARFRFVGAAYVHGIMQGEAATPLNDQDLQEAVLV